MATKQKVTIWELGKISGRRKSVPRKRIKEQQEVEIERAKKKVEKENYEKLEKQRKVKERKLKLEKEEKEGRKVINKWEGGQPQ